MEVAGGQAHLKTFYTIRFDNPMIVLCVFMIGISIAMIGFALSNSEPTTVVGLGIMLLLLCLALPARYGLTSDRLLWQNGIGVNKSLRLSEIDRIVPDEDHSGMTVSKVSGHRIYVGKKRFFVSAVNHDELLQALLERSPHLKQYGFEWRREFVV
jgi:hypothetical protein